MPASPTRHTPARPPAGKGLEERTLCSGASRAAVCPQGQGGRPPPRSVIESTMRAAAVTLARAKIKPRSRLTDPGRWVSNLSLRTPQRPSKRDETAGSPGQSFPRHQSGAQEFAFLTGSWVPLLLLAQRPHFENHSSGLWRRCPLATSLPLVPPCSRESRAGGGRGHLGTPVRLLLGSLPGARPSTAEHNQGLRALSYSRTCGQVLGRLSKVNLYASQLFGFLIIFLIPWIM